MFAEFFDTNRVIVYSAYGQVFFIVGLVSIMQSRRYSRLRLARCLWLLGVFGILHGASEWAYVFIPIQAAYLSVTVVNLLWLTHVVIESASFAVLLQFGVELVRDDLRRPWLRYIPASAFVLWGLIFGYYLFDLGLPATAGANSRVYLTGDVLGRYLMGLPGAVLVGVGLFREARIVRGMGLPKIARYLNGAAVGFLVYAFLAGLLVRKIDFFPANVLSYYPIWSATGVPVAVFRSIAGLIIAYFILRAIKVFEVEMDQMIASIQRARTLAAERERIGRELHDGTIQSIYAAGLVLEDIGYTLESDAGLARQKLRHAMESLDRTIGEIRRYVLNLRSPSEAEGFEERLQSVVEEFAASSGVAAKVRINRELHRPLASELAGNLLQVAREAFANVARHAAASKVEVNLTYTPESINLVIRDDGEGFDSRKLARPRSGYGLGLTNMSRRVDMIGGTLLIKTAPGQGTLVAIDVPTEQPVAS